tara:strand:+ start:199 stop:501 length:303 start_codon:yes stop_codon:yes gene_type:complete
VQIKESHATLVLLGILFMSMTTKKENVHIPNNQVSIIEYYQNPIYRYQKFPEKNWRNNLKIEIDTTSTYKDIISNVEPNSGRDWMERYQRGIQFEFQPPR